VKYRIYTLEKKVVLGENHLLLPMVYTVSLGPPFKLVIVKISYLTKARKETQPSLKGNRLIDSVLELARYA
jgi:hypothetical protein